MTSRAFCFWLKGYFEISQKNSLTEEQVSRIIRKLNEVFNESNNSEVLNNYFSNMPKGL